MSLDDKLDVFLALAKRSSPLKLLILLFKQEVKLCLLRLIHFLQVVIGLLKAGFPRDRKV